VKRVVVVGASGSGKSTLGTRLAQQLGVPRIDLDELYHRANWEPTPTPEFRAEVAEAIHAPGWVLAGNYTTVMDLTLGACDTVVWLDLPRWRTTARVVKRSLGRVIRREQLWNGNRERWRDLISRDPERNIILWAWQSHPIVTKRYEGFANGPFWSGSDVHRLRTPREVRSFLASAQGSQHRDQLG
jgi:adenylate kinase family enzyme